MDALASGSSSLAAPREVDASISPSKGRASAPALVLSTRRSSDSTVGITDSPHMLAEGLKTDEEDYSGHRSGDRGGSGGGRAALEATVIESAETIDTAPPEMAGQVSANRVSAGVLGGAGDENHLSRCESVGGVTTRAGSFCLPGSCAVGGGSPVARARGETASRGQGGGGGDLDGSEIGSEAGLTAVTATDTPAGTCVATAPGRGGRGGSGEVVGRADMEQVNGDGGGMILGGSMLDAYREPEGNDWEDELEDWRGLPGLQLAAGSGGGAAMRSRLQVT